MGLFMAIIIILTFTPIGLIDLPFIKATSIHVPVIIGAILLGPKYGAALGFMFGAGSLIKNTLVPGALSFAFSPAVNVLGTDEGSAFALVICFVPRILVGVIPWMVYEGLKKLPVVKVKAVNAVWLAIAGASGALTNTLLVMPMIYLVFKEPFALAMKIEADAVFAGIMGIIAANGIPEAIVAAVLTPVVAGVLQLVFKGDKK
jgi:uncharacterized membrane protein